MQTQILKVNAEAPEPEVIERAAEVVRAGGLVAFPTETVYGLGASALDESAVARIFIAKGRPATNPLIVHVTNEEQAQELASDWPEAAFLLAERFWPGPLTLVVRRRAVVPGNVTAGGPTVALRVPVHPVARALITAAALPIAAPSANRSSSVSPTRAAHVLRGLKGRIDLVLDGGSTPGGIESTVVDVTSTPPKLLRPGPIAPDDLETVIGPVSRGEPVLGNRSDQPLRSPGMLSRHYAPRAALELAAADAWQRVQALTQNGFRVGWLSLENQHAPQPGNTVRIDMPCEPAAYAARLYAALHDLDDAGVDRIVVDLPPQGQDWLAIHDRLRRACTS
jgi:L-threonylcarbamoyladenylate synthase